LQSHIGGAGNAKSSKIHGVFFPFVLTLALCSFAANSSNSKESANKATTEMSKKSSPAKSMHDVLAPAEDLSGTISFIAPSGKEVTLIGANGTQYDFRVTRTTRIDLAGRRISETELANENHKQATVRFLPTSQGNLAQTL
jgi:hypothetical protein